VSPNKNEWFYYENVRAARRMFWSLMATATGKEIDKSNKGGYNGSKWMVVGVVNSQVLERC